MLSEPRKAQSSSVAGCITHWSLIFWGVTLIKILYYRVLAHNILRSLNQLLDLLGFHSISW